MEIIGRKFIWKQQIIMTKQVCLFFFSFVYTGCVPLRQVLKEALDVREGDFYNSEEKHFQMWDSSGKIVS